MVVKRGRSDALPLFVCLNDLGNQTCPDDSHEMFYSTRVMLNWEV